MRAREESGSGTLRTDSGKTFTVQWSMTTYKPEVIEDRGFGNTLTPVQGLADAPLIELKVAGDEITLDALDGQTGELRLTDKRALRGKLGRRGESNVFKFYKESPQ